MKPTAHIASLVLMLPLALAVVVFALRSSGADDDPQRISRGNGAREAVVDAQGNLHVPSNYRQAYESLGTWAIAAEKGVGSRELHMVFASPGSVAAYHRDGHFPDGTVLIKEVHETATEPMTTGTVSHAQALKGWFVMVKDSQNRHPGNLLWGDGWGWSWFDAANPTKTTSTGYKANCLACHIPAQSTDWVYVSGYPPLR